MGCASQPKIVVSYPLKIGFKPIFQTMAVMSAEYMQVYRKKRKANRNAIGKAVQAVVELAPDISSGEGLRSELAEMRRTIALLQEDNKALKEKCAAHAAERQKLRGKATWHEYVRKQVVGTRTDDLFGALTEGEYTVMLNTLKQFRANDKNKTAFIKKLGYAIGHDPLDGLAMPLEFNPDIPLPKRPRGRRKSGL